MEALVNELSTGNPVLLATDTVYGLAAVPGSAGVAEIFRIKQRPADQAMAWLVPSASSLDELGCDIPEYAHKLADMFWPGACTLIVHASQAACALGDVAQDGTVALRMPDDAACLEVLARLGKPLTCTSANLHGEPACVEFEQLPQCLAALPHLAAITPRCPGGIASTVVDCTDRFPVVTRQGAISEHVIMDVALLDARLNS